MLPVIFLIVLTVLAGSGSATIRTRVIDLPVDHFNPLDRRTFDARYFVNADHWYPRGVIFIYVGGGFEVYDEFLSRGAMFELARDTNSLLFSLEHRYFGESRPVPDTSVENLQFLTIHQTLADLAQFVAFIRANYNGASGSRVILWGRGYGGALAVWARQKYPNAFDAVWASSAYLDARVEYPNFMRNTFYTINSIGGPECGGIITGAFRQIEDAIRTRNTSHVEQRLKLCTPIEPDLEEDITRLYYGIAADIGYVYLSNAGYTMVDDKCTLMRGLNTPDNLPVDDLDGFARWFADDFNRNLECINYNNEATIARYSNIQWNTVSTIAGRRQTFWLQCTQLGQFAVANEGDRHPWGGRFDFSFFRDWCARVFDEQLFTNEFIQSSMIATNNLYGGLNPHVYRVLFTHGEMDPRRQLGPNEDLNEHAPVIYMTLQSAGRDFGSPSETDYVVLQQTKARARELMIKWIFDAIDEENTPAPPVTPLSTFDGEAKPL